MPPLATSQTPAATAFPRAAYALESPTDSTWGLSTGGSVIVNDEPYDAVFFQNYGVNPFVDTEDDHLSTFALDVDTASYTVACRFLRDGNLPDPDTVRVEEFVNYFQQDLENILTQHVVRLHDFHRRQRLQTACRRPALQA